jgi:DNA-binding LytR/AlgR family response regulator
VTRKVYLVDDEPLALARLAGLLEATGRVEIVGRQTSPERAIAELASSPAELVFLDISMPVLDGFDVCARLAPGVAVVFTTAHDEHALRAFRTAAVDYLLKPIRAEDLGRALDKIDRLLAQPAATLAAAMERILAAAETAPRARPRIASRLGDRVQFVELERVSHFVAEHKLTYAVTAERTHVVDATIAELERRFAGEFVRVHRAALVRVAAIVELHAGVGATRVRLDSGHELDVARDRVKAVRERLQLSTS